VLLKFAGAMEEIEYNSSPMDLSYQNAYFDDGYFNSNGYIGPEYGPNDFGEEYLDPPYYDSYYESFQNVSPMSMVQSESYDQLIAAPKMNMYYPETKLYNSVQYHAGGPLGYQPYLSEVPNTNSTTFSAQTLPESQSVFTCSKSQLHKGSPEFK